MVVSPNVEFAEENMLKETRLYHQRRAEGEHAPLSCCLDSQVASLENFLFVKVIPHA